MATCSIIGRAGQGRAEQRQRQRRKAINYMHAYLATFHQQFNNNSSSNNIDNNDPQPNTGWLVVTVSYPPLLNGHFSTPNSFVRHTPNEWVALFLCPFKCNCCVDLERDPQWIKYTYIQRVFVAFQQPQQQQQQKPRLCSRAEVSISFTHIKYCNTCRHRNNMYSPWESP